MSPNTTSSSNSDTGRCGMCGSCGTMPPWAPEMLKNTSPEARRTLERRMREAQMRFIEERDARMQAEKMQNHPSATEPCSPTQHTRDDDGVQMSPINNQEISNLKHATQVIHHDDQGKQDWKPFSDQALKKPAQHTMQQLSSPGQVSREPQVEMNATRELVIPANSDLHLSGAQLEVDANVDSPLGTAGLPPLPLSDDEIHQSETSNLKLDVQHVFQPTRRKPPLLSSPALLESPLPSETPELHTLPDISLEQNQLSEPLRTISLRDADSDADSYHTAQGEDVTQLSSDSLSLRNDEELVEGNVAPIVSEVEWQAFQDDDAVSEPNITAPEKLRPAFSESPVTSTENHALQEGHTRDMTTSELSSSRPESLASQPSENPDDSMMPRTTTGVSSPLAHRDVRVDDYALPADLVHRDEIEFEPRPCQDCERWRERVQELELKVEALTSALNAREMETASMRARAVDRRYHGKNEAQLMEECESLRITTEYLVRIHSLFLSTIFANVLFLRNTYSTQYHKLEGYEKKLSGSHPDVH